MLLAPTLTQSKKKKKLIWLSGESMEVLLKAWNLMNG